MFGLAALLAFDPLWRGLCFAELVHLLFRLRGNDRSSIHRGALPF